MKSYISFMSIIMNVLLFFTSYGQEQLDGGYKSLEDFKNNKPSFTETFEITKRSRSDIVMWGGNDYKIRSPLQTTNNSLIN